jgi:hypothetical protein
MAVNANVFSEYRKAKRDLNTANEIASGGNGSGTIILALLAVIVCVSIFVAIVKRITNKAKSIYFIDECRKKLENGEITEFEFNKIEVSLKNSGLKFAKNQLEHLLSVKEAKKICDDKLANSIIDKQGYEDLNVFLDNNGVVAVIGYRTVTFEERLANVMEETKRRKSLISKYGLEKAMILLNQEFYLGMSKDEVLDAKNSEPDIKETEVLKTKTKDIWVWGNKSSGDVFVFVDDKLERFKDR